VLPEGLELASCAVVRLVGQGGRDVGLGKLIDAVDVVIAPAPDGIAHDAARVERIARAFLARDRAEITRAERVIDVRALVIELDVISGDAVRSLCSALDWPDAPALLRARLPAAGSCKPVELARALGVWGGDDPRAEHAHVARLGVVTRDGDIVAACATSSP
jgi:hypothetical protein